MWILSCYLHFADDSQLPARGEQGYSRLQKVEPIISAMKQRCLSFYRPNAQNGIDEAMISMFLISYTYNYVNYCCVEHTYYSPICRPIFHEAVCASQTNQVGLQGMVRADAITGYFCDLDVYVGRPSDRGSTEVGLGERVILQLCRPLCGGNYQVFCDNFSATGLFKELLQQNIYTCGTAQIDRHGFPETV